MPLKRPTPEQYLHDLENLASRFPDEPLAFFQTGFLVSQNCIPKYATIKYRQALLPIASLTAKNFPLGWKLLNLFNSIILAP